MLLLFDRNIGTCQNLQVDPPSTLLPARGSAGPALPLKTEKKPQPETFTIKVKVYLDVYPFE